MGVLTGADPDANDQFTFSLVPGEGATDNARFQMVGAELRTAEVLTGVDSRAFSIRVRITDRGGLSFEHIIRIRLGSSSAPARK